MDHAATIPDVMTLEEVSLYLRLPNSAVERLAARGEIPARRAGKEWRFLKAALDGWLRGDDRTISSRDEFSSPDHAIKEESRTRADGPTMLEQFGRFATDETLDPLRDEVYAGRKRPEVDRDGAP